METFASQQAKCRYKKIITLLDYHLHLNLAAIRHTQQIVYSHLSPATLNNVSYFASNQSVATIHFGKAQKKLHK